MKYQISNPIKFPFSSEQGEAVNKVLSGVSVDVNACAGSGKSYAAFGTAVNYDGKVYSIPFSRTLADEEQRKYADHAHVHALNFHRWGRKLIKGRVKTDFKKVLKLAESVNGEKAMGVSELATKLKTEGFGVYDKALSASEVAVKYSIKEELVDDAVKVLELSDKDKSTIDFDDMLRFPILQGSFQLLEGLILLDEVQDYTPAAFAFLTNCLTTSDSQVLMIGDPSRQNLMAFAGANPDLYSELVSHFGCESVNFTVNRRCAKAVIAAAPHKGNMVALPDAPEGIVETLPMSEVLNDVCNGLYENDAILSEANAPLIKLGIELLTKGVPVRMRITKLEKVIYVAAREFLNTKTTKVGDVYNKFSKQIDKLASEGADVTTLKDLARCVELLENYCLANGITETVWNFRKPCHPIFQALNIMVNSKEGITLLTGHTAKGLEWNTVFYLEGSMRDPEQDWQQQQADCLAHVIATRAITRFVTLVE